MRTRALLLAALLSAAVPPAAAQAPTAQLGPRPFYLVEDLSPGPLKAELQACAERPQFTRRLWSIGHRGAPLQFPEHTKESYEAAARMGAGIVECDVTFTKDRQLVCRHAQNDLHTTTDILATPLAARCARPFTPASFAPDGRLLVPASAECRTSDITLAEFKTLRGKMDAADPRARTVAEYMAGTAPWRTELYTGPGGGTLLTHAESIALFQRLGVGMTPELKAPVVAMPFEGWSQADYAQRLVDEYKAAGVPPERVWPQSFNAEDLRHWLKHEPAFARQAVLLDGTTRREALPGAAQFAAWKAEGIRIWAPPLFALLALDDNGRLTASKAAREAKAAGLDIITWSLERSGHLRGGNAGFFYQGLGPALQREGDVLRVLDVLAREVGVVGVFSDWPATTTFFANCAGLR